MFINLSGVGAELLRDRVWVSLTTMPHAIDWLVMLGLGLGFAAIALPVGWVTGFLRVAPLPDRPTAVSTALVALIYPGILEEVLFRALPIPRSATATPMLLWVASGLSLLVFIAAHPLNALVFFPSRKKTFFDPVFLSLAGLLGLVCTLSYIQSGSLWPAIILHWAIVILWLLYLGGYQRLVNSPVETDASST